MGAAGGRTRHDYENIERWCSLPRVSQFFGKWLQKMCFCANLTVTLSNTPGKYGKEMYRRIKRVWILVCTVTSIIFGRKHLLPDFGLISSVHNNQIFNNTDFAKILLNTWFQYRYCNLRRVFLLNTKASQPPKGLHFLSFQATWIRNGH